MSVKRMNWHGLESWVGIVKLDKSLAAVTQAISTKPAATPTSSLDALRDRLEKKLEAEIDKSKGVKRKLEELQKGPAPT